MEKINRCALFMYMFSTTLGTLSNSFLYTIIVSLGSKYDVSVNMVIRPILLMLGALMGCLLLEKSRRWTLIISNILVTLNVICGVFTETFLIYISELLMGFFFALNYVVVLLMVKEIPPFNFNGMPLVLLNAFEFLGYSFSLGTLHILKHSFGIYLYKNNHFYIRLVIVLCGCIPILVQTLLMIFVHKYEPAGFSLSKCSEEEALLSLRPIYKDRVDAENEISRMVFISEERRRTFTTWNRALCSEKWRYLFILCFFLIMFRFWSGFYSYALPLFELSSYFRSLGFVVSEFTFFVFIVVTGFLIDRYPIYELMKIGLGFSACLNIILSTLYILNRAQTFPLILIVIIAILESAIQISLVTIVCYKFMISLLPDKTLLAILATQFLGFVFYAYPLSLIPSKYRKWVLFSEQMCFTLGSICFFFFALKFVKKYIPSFKKKSESMLWKLQNDLEREESRMSDSMIA